MASASTPREDIAVNVTWALCPVLMGKPVKVSALQGLMRSAYLNIPDAFHLFVFYTKLCFGFPSNLVSSVCGEIGSPAGPLLFV